MPLSPSCSSLEEELSSGYQLDYHLAFTKNAQEPECGHETTLFSGRTIYVIGLLQLTTD